MKKITFLAVIIGFLVTCNCHASQRKTEKEEFVLQQGDTLFYKNDNFRVVGREKKDYAGYTFRIYNQKTKQSFDYAGSETDAFWYLSVYDTYLLLDEGTGVQHRGFVLIDMKNGEKVHRFNYVAYDGSELKGNTFTYWLQIDKLPQGIKSPNCPQLEGVPEEQFGYIEKWMLNLDTLKFKNLKEYKCIYFE